ncbi:S8 family serine peptidase [Paraburkholderia bannensis]|uniref:S8 family serine peptidase n=1 Tax=Paraburkholderia bannensis TaxID=765414 RepID=UPI002ABDAAD1|nr:S8 family serine peptidase [Paraburkholderia bannensis]
MRLAAYAATAMMAAVLAACGGGSNSNDASPASNNSVTPPPGDPLAQYQWHLKNTGQSTFSGRGGTPGIDLNVDSLFNQGEIGAGVRVLVLDDGLDIGHLDLKDRIAPDMLYNFDPSAASTSDPTPANNSSHGTEVAGIIGATADNGIGVRGVAPGVRLGGARYLCIQDDQTTNTCDSPSMTLSALGGAPFSQSADVINGSFGASGPALQEFDPDSSVRAAAVRHLTTLRQGKGIVFVKAAGNEFDSLGDSDCKTGIACGNAALDPQNTMPQTIVVGAVNADGVKSSYSSSGSAVLVAGLGGEYGFPGRDNATSGPAIMTTDLSGCNRGSVRTGQTSENPFNDPSTEIAKSLNTQCNYTATMNGTSAATPTVAGVVALMLHANPQLTWRDVRTILSASARRVDAQRVPTTMSLADGETYTPEPAWTRNGAGRWFDNWYGFGLVDAAAAVAMAKSYSTYLSGAMNSSTALAFGTGCNAQSEATDACGSSIATGKSDGLTVALQIGGQGVNTIEAVQLSLNLFNVSVSDLAVELISPAGTRSVLFNAFNGVLPGVTNVSNFVLSSNAFNGEAAGGVWKLRFVDVAQRADPESGSFQSVKLNVMGH